jgi:hypothetical protein
MSHFCTIVVGDDPESQLEPFREYDGSPDFDKSLLTYVDRTDEITRIFNDTLDEVFISPNGKIYIKYDRKFAPDYNCPKGFTCKRMRPKDHYSSLEKFAKEWDECRPIPNKPGRYGYLTNENGKWDWHTLGGRYENRLVTKTGCYGNQFAVGELDFKEMRAARKKLRRMQWGEYLKMCKESGKEYSAELYEVKSGDTMKTYSSRATPISAFAVLKDGVFYENGKVGWFGMVSKEMTHDDWNSELNKLLESLPKDTLISVYDLHI